MVKRKNYTVITTGTLRLPSASIDSLLHRNVREMNAGSLFLHYCPVLTSIIHFMSLDSKVKLGGAENFYVKYVLEK